MPADLQTFIWIFGVALIAILLSIVAYFVIRLINGLDTFKVEITGTINQLNATMASIRKDLGSELTAMHTRVTIIEAGCEFHRRKEDKPCSPS